MTEDIRWKQRFDNFNRALHQLTLAVELSQQRAFTELEKQGVIHGFEFVHELGWNVLNDFLEYEGILPARRSNAPSAPQDGSVGRVALSPKRCFRSWEKTQCSRASPAEVKRSTEDFRFKVSKNLPVLLLVPQSSPPCTNRHARERKFHLPGHDRSCNLHRGI